MKDAASLLLCLMRMFGEYHTGCDSDKVKEAHTEMVAKSTLSAPLRRFAAAQNLKYSPLPYRFSLDPASQRVSS